MKNLFKNLMLVAVAAMAFTACTETNEEVNATNEKVTITFAAGFGEDTRVSLDNSDNDKVYKAAWEEGDTVTFAVYENATTDQNSPKEVKTMTIAAPSESVELTVTFDNLTDGNVIKAFVNYNVNQYGDYYYFELDWYYAPYDNDPEVYASASVVYTEGVDYATLSFEHDFAYGLMTFENLPIAIDRLSYIDIKADGKKVSVNYDHLTGNQFWFNIDEDLDVDKLDIVAYSKDLPGVKYYFSRTFANDGEFKFTKGRVSRFTVKTWKGELATPEVETTVSGKTITLNWASVEGADGYRIEITDYNGFSDEVSLGKDAVSYEFSAPLEDTYYYFLVYACANEDNASYVTSQVCDIYEQSGNTTPAIILNPTSLSFAAEGAEAQTVEVTLNNIDGGFTFTASHEWIHVAAEGNTLTVTVDDTEEAREGSITVSAGGLTADITVAQEANATGEPEPGIKIYRIAVGYDSDAEKEIQFYFEPEPSSKCHVIDFKGYPNVKKGQPVAAGYYSSQENTIDEGYSIYDYGTTNGDPTFVDCTVTNNPDGTQTYEARMVYNGITYSWTYTGNYPA